MIKSGNDLMTSFRQFQTDGGRFSDLKIVPSEDSNQGFDVHRLVFSAASSYMYNILANHEDQDDQIIILLPELGSVQDIQALIDYIYQGEVKIQQDNIESFLKLVKILQIPIDSVFTLNEYFKDERIPPPFQDFKFDNIGVEVVEDPVQLPEVIAPLTKFSCPFKGCGKIFHLPDDVEGHISSEHLSKPKTVNFLTSEG